jgi:hypothetical protein
MDESFLKAIASLIIVLLIAVSVMGFLSSSAKDDPNHTTLGSSIMYLFVSIGLAYVTYV